MAGETILVVEDEPLVGVELQEQLTFLGYRVPEVLTEGAEVRGAAARLKPDLVLMDIRLKGQVDGIDAADDLRRTSDVPIMFLTAYSDPRTVSRAATILPDGFLLKPFRERELEVNVAMVLQKSKSRMKDEKNLGKLVPFLDSLESALVLYGEDGRWVHGNARAREILGSDRWETALAALTGTSLDRMTASPGVWFGREHPLAGQTGGVVLSIDALTKEDGRAYGYLVSLESMDRQERAHLSSSVAAINSALVTLLPEDGIYGERLRSAGFLVSRPSGTGDFYDVFPVGPHHFVFYSLDVAGHGVLPAMAVYSLRSMIREMAGNALVRTNEVPSPGHLLESLNRRFLATGHEGVFFTIALGILTPSSGEYRLIRAGHPSVLLVGPGRRAEPLPGDGPALGVLPEVTFREASGRLRPGERLVLCSDGVLEHLGTRSPHEGSLALARILMEGGSVEDQARAVEEACFRAPVPVTDDLSLLILEPGLW